MQVMPPLGRRSGGRYVVQVIADGEALARRTGLLDRGGRAVRGLPVPVVAGGACDAAAVWRGAFLVQGSLSEPGRSPVLEVGCPGPEAAMALVGAVRRLGITTKTREVRGAYRVQVRDEQAIGELLTRMGAVHSHASWQQRRLQRTQHRSTVQRLAPFEDANQERAAAAALANTARVQRALQLLGAGAPGHLRAAGALRLHHQHVSLKELGRLAVPPLPKSRWRDGCADCCRWPTVWPAKPGFPTPPPPSPPTCTRITDPPTQRCTLCSGGDSPQLTVPTVPRAGT